MAMATALAGRPVGVGPTEQADAAARWSRMPAPKETVGDRLRRYRRAKRITQAHLAETAGTNDAYIARLESGAIHEPNIDTLRRIARALNVRLRDLAEPLGWYEDEESEGEVFDTWEQVERAILNAENLDDAQKNGLILVLKPAVTAMLAENTVRPERKRGRAAS